MKGWMIRWLVSIIALLVTAKIIPDFELTIWAAIVSSVFLGIINTAILPLFKLMPFTFSYIRLGVLTLIVNGCMMWLTAVTVKGFEWHGVWQIMAAVVLFGVICFVINVFITDERKYWR